MTPSLKQKRAVNRRARQNKRSGLELIVQGSPALVGQEILQPKFPLASSLDNQPYNFVRSVSLGPITSSTSVDVKTNFSFKLSDIDDYTSFTGVFDQYKIKLVEVLFLPRTNSSSTTNNVGIFGVAPDYDDVSNVTNLAGLLDYSTATAAEGYSPQRRVIEPHVATALYSGSVFTSFGNATSQWIDAASPDVPHYGMKTIWTATSAVCNMDVIVKYWVQFRNSR